ncbi:MAG TPA: AAA family ATPase [bacterium]|nr:AAA family ATPase [bacterium]
MIGLIGITEEYNALKKVDNPFVTKLLGSDISVTTYIWGVNGNGKTMAIQSWLFSLKTKQEIIRVKEREEHDKEYSDRRPIPDFKYDFILQYITMSDLVMEFYKCEDNGNVNRIKTLDKFKAVDVLAIDEIDKVALTTDYKAELIFNLFDGRKGGMKKTITAGNTSPDKLGSVLNKAIVSRVLSDTVIENTGKTLR